MEPPAQLVQQRAGQDCGGGLCAAGLTAFGTCFGILFPAQQFAQLAQAFLQVLELFLVAGVDQFRLGRGGNAAAHAQPILAAGV